MVDAAKQAPAHAHAHSRPPAERLVRPLGEVLLDKGNALFSGRLDVEGGALTGSLHLSEGMVVDARVGSAAGEPALWRMLLLPAPTIVVEPGRPRTTEGAVLGKPQALLPRFDERFAVLRRYADKVGGFEQVWAIRFDALAARLDDLPDAINPVLRLLDGRRTVRQVVCECPLDDLLALRILQKLLALGILMLADSTGAPAPAGPADVVVEDDGGLEAALLRSLEDDREAARDDAGGTDAAARGDVDERADKAPSEPMPAPGSAARSPSALIDDAASAALPSAVPKLETQEDLRSWLGSEEAFFSQAPTTSPGVGMTPWQVIGLLIAGVILGLLLTLLAR